MECAIQERDLVLDCNKDFMVEGYRGPLVQDVVPQIPGISLLHVNAHSFEIQPILHKSGCFEIQPAWVVGDCMVETRRSTYRPLNF